MIVFCSIVWSAHGLDRSQVERLDYMNCLLKFQIKVYVLEQVQ